VALALELKADILPIDEQAARGVASQLGLSIIGLMGVLLRAKTAGHLPAVRPVLDDLIGRAGFWVSATLYTAVLNLAGE
jgi:predicted nucleic acid-binding protein